MISVRLSVDDERLVKKYAELHDISLSELFRSAVLERIENELDLKLYNEAMAEFEKNPVSYTLDEVERELSK